MNRKKDIDELIKKLRFLQKLDMDNISLNCGYATTEDNERKPVHLKGDGLYMESDDGDVRILTAEEFMEILENESKKTNIFRRLLSCFRSLINSGAN